MTLWGLNGITYTGTSPNVLQSLGPWYNTGHLIRLLGISREAAIGMEDRWMSLYVMMMAIVVMQVGRLGSQTLYPWVIPYGGLSSRMTWLREVYPDLLWNPAQTWPVCFHEESICTSFWKSPSNNDINKPLHYRAVLTTCPALSYRGGLFHVILLISTWKHFSFFFSSLCVCVCVLFLFFNLGKEAGKALPS